MFDMVIRNADTFHVAYTRRIYKTKEEALEETERIKAVLPKNILGQRTVIINYETEYREQDFDLAACAEITGKLPKSCGYEEKNIALPGDVASLVCRDNELEEAYRSITRQLEETPCQIVGAFIEIFHDDGTVELKVPVCRLSKNSVFVSNDINLPFENDEDVVGKWEMLDIVPSKEQFLYGDEKCNHRAWLHELYFLDGSKPYWAVAGWTKGFLYTMGERPQYTLKNKYTIENFDGHTLLFLEMKHYMDGKGLGFGMPEIWVYKKVDSKKYTANDIRIKDNMDYPFVTDTSVLGAWKVHDFVLEENEFDALKQSFPKESLFLLRIEFTPDGECIWTTRKQVSTLAWTKGLILNRSLETASAYEIRLVDGKEYLFMQWKSGDYQFGGGRIYWYVLTRE